MSTVRGRVLRSQSGEHLVETDDGAIRCSLRGRLKRGRATSDLVVIGDWVRLTVTEGGGVIEEVLPRDNRFARRQPGSRGRYKEHVLVANLDWLVVVFACAKPPMNPRVLDRFLVLAEHDHLSPLVVANKVDQVDEDAVEAQFGIYRSLGYPVIGTSATTGVGVEALRERLRDRVSAFVGPSGVGKTSLLNALEPTLGRAVGEVSELLHKGKHTTRVAELHEASFGGYVADTPGIREIASFAMPEAELSRCFPEMREPARQCRFNDCVHDREPGCGVRAALEDGAISAARYDSYQRIRRGEDR